METIRGSTRLPNESQVFSAAVQGPGHFAKDVGCQDAVAHAVTDDWVLLAVSDGLGSARLAQEGATLAASSAVAAGVHEAGRDRTIDADHLARHMLVSAREALEGAAELPLREYACTLITCAAKGSEVAVAHIGDGAVVGWDANELCLISPPAPSEYVNEVEHLCQDDWHECVRIAVRDPVTALAAFTDGVQRAALSHNTDAWSPFDRFLLPLFEHVIESDDPALVERELTRFLGGRVMNEHSEDDKTLAFVLLGQARTNGT